MIAKLVAALVSPLGTAWLLGLLALGLAAGARRWGWRRGGMAAGWTGLAAVGWLWLWATPLASDALRGALENQAGPRTVEAVAPAPVLVVLGGGVQGASPPQRPHPNLGAAADRVWHAARLYHAGKAPKVLLSGGVLGAGDGSEAEAMQTLLLDLGVPASALLLEGGSHNTGTNAALSARLLAAQNVDTVMLVTSALHMPRARQAFERAGLTVIPAPTDFEVIPRPFSALRLLPDTEALDGSARAFKEIVGRLAGR